ncbi:LapA family protein [Alkalihalobacillus sp. CinArs1]|uniref:LapA family protein n=1 Tax=Alkalihalobacillus sp. CinArs1 TaxID=2995314 RepID=UPI0022DDE127|nr:lipopolysaccharide assembly LapA domain-containing protein [Alkalihalobacillus sp. CinArs1]
MKGQWGLVVALIFALIIAVFSVVNVDPVQVNYVFGTSEWPLVLVILGSVLMGAILVLGFGMVKYYKLSREVKRLRKENLAYSEQPKQTPQPEETPPAEEVEPVDTHSKTESESK